MSNMPAITLKQLKERASYTDGQYILTDEDLTALDFSTINHVANFAFIDCNLNGSNLSGVTFVDTVFNGGWAEDSIAKGVVFDNCDLSCTNFDRSDMSDAQFINTKMYEMEFHGADFKNADISDNDLELCRFFNCNMLNSNFSKSNLDLVAFHDSNLTCANLENIKANQVYICDTVLEGVRWAGTNIDEIELEDCAFFASEVF